MTTNLPPQLQYSPYFAGLDGKTAAESDVLQNRIDALPEKARSLIFDSEVPDKLKNILDQSGVPTQYVLAMAKILFLAALGDVAVGSIEHLLEKLGLEQRQASVVGAGITMLLGDIITERGRATIGQSIKTMPPLTQRVSPMNLGPDSSKTPARNIIDLRERH